VQRSVHTEGEQAARAARVMRRVAGRLHSKELAQTLSGFQRQHAAAKKRARGEQLLRRVGGKWRHGEVAGVVKTLKEGFFTAKNEAGYSAIRQLTLTLTLTLRPGTRPFASSSSGIGADPPGQGLVAA
jgi:hypothetical protein